MANIGLDRADQQRAVRAATTPVDRRHCVDLDRVTHLCPSPVGFQIVDVRWEDPCPLERCRDDALLRHPARNRQTRACPILIQCRAPDHAPDAVVVRLRISEPL